MNETPIFDEVRQMFGIMWPVAPPEPVAKEPYPDCPNCKKEWHGLPTEWCEGSHV